MNSLNPLQIKALEVIEHSRLSQDAAAVSAAETAATHDATLEGRTTYRALADTEAYLLNRFIYRDHRKRLIPFLARATQQFTYVHQPLTTILLPRGGYRHDHTDKLVSPLMFATEGDTVEGLSDEFVAPDLISGWEVEIERPPYWSARFLSGDVDSNELALRQVVRTEGDNGGENARTVSSCIYPLAWAELNRGQTLPKEPNDEFYQEQFQILRGIRTVLSQ